MDVKYHDIKTIFDTLPIGYYVGRPIKVNLSETDKISSYSQASDSITISAPMIIDTFKSSPKLTQKDLEEVIRGLLYHEVSHIMLSCNPKYLEEYVYDYCKKNIYDIMEDERIETIFSGRFANTNFRKNVFLINKYNGAKPVTKEQKFFYLVRYHAGPDKWVKRLSEFIYRWRQISPADSLYYWKDYASEVNNFYEAYCVDISTVKDPSVFSTPFFDSHEDSDIPEELYKYKPSDADYVSHRVSEYIFEKYENTRLQKKIKNIIEVAHKKKGMYAGSRIGYSGKINPKNCGRDDFQWWKKNTSGSNTSAAPLHFNLFIDNSGSFEHNDQQVNELLRALNKIKSPMFHFDVITMNSEIVEWESSTSQLFASTGGNNLWPSIHGIFRDHQKPGCNNFNIVLFDGDAHSNDNCYTNYSRIGPNGKDNFSAFDTENTIIISDHGNAKYIDGCITRARVKYTKHYCSEFIGCLTALLEQML